MDNKRLVAALEKMAEATAANAEAIATLNGHVERIERGLAEQAEGMRKTIEKQRERAEDMDRLSAEIRSGGKGAASRRS